MSKAITKASLARAAFEAAETAATAPGVPVHQIESVARQTAEMIVEDPAIAPALKPVSRLASETIQGIVAAGAAQILQITGLAKTIVIVAGAFGQQWNADDVSTVATTVLTIGGLAWAWYGRETTTRPLA